MNKLYAELKRRKVIKVVTAYLIAGWLVLQLADIVREPLGMPDWLFQAILALLLVGLVLTVIIAWVFDFTPDGIRRTPAAGTVDAAAGISTGRKIDFIIIALLAFALIAFIGKDKWFGGPAAPQAAADHRVLQSIAVLPFVSMSSDTENEYFADGLSEELLNLLAKIKDLKVAGRTSSFYFKGRDIDLREIGKQLNVNHVLEGSVRKSGNRVRITAQLISVADGYHLWSETYDRQLDDIFKIQEEIARAVTQALKVTLLGATDQALANTPDIDPEAHSLYLIARSRQRERGRDNLTQAMHLFESIIEKSPEFAPAYSGLSDSVLLLSNNHFDMSFADARAKAEPLVEKALQLEPDSSEAWTSKGFLDQQIFQSNGDDKFRSAAETAYLKAHELDPNNAQALYWYGILMDDTGNYAAAIDLFRQSLELDPLARIPRYRLALDYQQAGDFEKARAALEESLRLYPDFATAKAALGTMELGLGHFETAEKIILEIAKSPAGAADGNIYFNLYAIYSNIEAHELAQEAIAKVPPSPIKTAVDQILAAQQSGDIDIMVATLNGLADGENSALQWKMLAAQVAYLSGNYAQSRERLEKLYPKLYTDDPAVNLQTLYAATISAAALKKLGQTGQADRLLQEARAIYESKWTTYVPSGVHYRLAELLAIQGHMDEAMRHLTAAYDEGYRLVWTDFSYRMDANPYFGALREDPRFVALVAKIIDSNKAARQRILAAHEQEDEA